MEPFKNVVNLTSLVQIMKANPKSRLKQMSAESKETINTNRNQLAVDYTKTESMQVLMHGEYVNNQVLNLLGQIDKERKAAADKDKEYEKTINKSMEYKKNIDLTIGSRVVDACATKEQLRVVIRNGNVQAARMLLQDSSTTIRLDLKPNDSVFKQAREMLTKEYLKKEVDAYITNKQSIAALDGFGEHLINVSTSVDRVINPIKSAIVESV